VSVNGQKEIDFSRLVYADKDKLSVDGKPLSIKSYTYVAMHKPPGIVVSMNDEQGRETVMDLLPPSLRHLRPVGRLDMYSEGLLVWFSLMTAI
jgi:23S rRNA pseudouridine2605 synthase